MNVKELDSTKIYWLDKEETVKAKLVGLDLPNGFGSVKYTFRVIHGGTGDIIYMDSNLPKTIHEVVESKQWKFTTPIAMKCTEEQFNEIKGKLVEMGYILYGITFGEKYRYLSSNFDNDVRCITDLAIGSKYFKECNPIIFESFNPDLFLALAAMTDKEDGIKGEVYTNSCGKFYTKDDGKEGKWHNTFWRKATAQEIIEHFEKKGKKEADRIFKLVLDFQSSLFNKINEDKTIIHIPPTKQATLFDDRVEITDWKPKEGDFVFYIAYWNDEFRYTNTFYNDNFKKEFNNGFIKRTECEAKRLVEKLKQAML